MSQKNLLVFTHGGGRLANQLTNYAHLYAFWLEHRDRFDVINLAFSPYASLFSGSEGDRIGTFPDNLTRWSFVTRILSPFLSSRENNTRTISNQVMRVLHLSFGMMPWIQSIKKGVAPNYLPLLFGKRISDLGFDDEASLTALKRTSATLLAGWPIRGWKTFEKHAGAIRSFFRTSSAYRGRAESFIRDVRTSRPVLIGVLMRQDDYRVWNNGVYFFPTQQYVEWMKQIMAMPFGRDAVFVIASDEQQDRSLFEGLPVRYTTGQKMGDGHFIESFTELSMCDYVLTPPSTFGIWAAFLGDVPIIPVYEKGQVISEDQFLRRNIFDAIRHPHMSVSIQ